MTGRWPGSPCNFHCRRQERRAHATRSHGASTCHSGRGSSGRDRILFASWGVDAYQGDEESQFYTIHLYGSGLTQITDVDHTSTRRRPGEATWTPGGQ